MPVPALGFTGILVVLWYRFRPRRRRASDQDRLGPRPLVWAPSRVGASPATVQASAAGLNPIPLGEVTPPEVTASRAASPEGTLQQLTRQLHRGPILRNLAGAVSVQGALLVSGTLSARMLGPTNRGYLAVLATCASTIGQIGGFGISIAATYYLASGQLSGYEVFRVLRRPAAAQILILTSVYTATVSAYMLIGGAPILLPVCLSLLQLPMLLTMDYGIAFALGGRRHGITNVLRAVGPTIYAGTCIVLYLYGPHSLDAIVLASVSAAVIAGASAILVGVRIARSVTTPTSLLRRMSPRGARRELLRFGRRGYVGLLSPTDTFRIDQLVVAFLLAPRYVGIYAVGAAFTNFTRLVGFNIGMSATTEVARQTDIAQQRAVVRHTLRQSGVIIAAVSLVIGLLVTVAIPLLFGHAYRSAVPIAECLLVATGLLAMKRISVDLMRGAGETRLGTRAEIVNVVVFFILCGPAAFTFGSLGVAGSLAVATALGYMYLRSQMRTHGFGSRPR